MFNTVVILFPLILQLFANVSCTKSKFEAKRDILNQILPTNRNEILIPPGNGTSEPTVVQVFLHVKSIKSLNYEKMELTTSMYFRQMWTDFRLQYDGNQDNISSIVINDPQAIWTPDIYFSNLLKGHSNDLMRPNTFIRISSDGTVLYSKFVSLTTSCPMDLKRFPFDNQACDVLLSTYGSTSEEVILIWKKDKPATISKNAHTLLFSLDFFSTYSRAVSVSGGKYNILVLTFLFQRGLRYYFFRIFIPLMMFVILSWISLWINRKRIGIRLFLGISALVTSTLLVYDQHKFMAKVSYNTSMDIFTGTILTLIFVSIIESTFVHVLGEIADTKEQPICVDKEKKKSLNRCKNWFTTISRMADTIDYWSRLIIPLASVIFYSVYFSIANARGGDDLPSATNYTE